MYLNAFFMGSVLEFNKIIKRQGSRVLLDNGQYVTYRNKKYYKVIPGWETIHYKLFETKQDCIDYINKNYEEYKVWNCEQDLNKLLNQKCFEED